MSDTPTEALPRRHDLDALRAFAMVLGIALHASLSFTGYPWPVQDLRPNGIYLALFAVIHGFRMPLFILVSGYFTMMLWRQRGMKSLLKQRFRRVFVPCMIGLVTVIPALIGASIWAAKQTADQDVRRRPESASKSELVESIRQRDKAGLERQLLGGADANQADPETGVPSLAWAAMYGDLDTARLLLDHGADVNGKDRSGYRALHSAAFLGYSEVADLLITRGADPKAKGPMGDTARDSTRADLSMTKAILDGLKVPNRDEDELQAGRARCRQLLSRFTTPGATDDPDPAVSPWSLEGVRKLYAAALSSEIFFVRLSPGGAPFHLILTPVFHHLWFLWFLCWLVGIFAVVAPLAEKFAGGRFPSRLVTSPLRWLWVVPLTMVPQLLMGVLVPSFGPDTSTGLLPQPHVLLYYAIFFGFGALYYDAHDRDGQLGRWWWLTLPLALLVLFPAGLVTTGQIWLSGVLQVAFAWAMTFGLIGLFRKALKRENRTIRYLADSAYWLYLAHLPLVIVLQAQVRDWELPSALKFLYVCTMTTAILLVAYQFLVRYSWIGRMLNGPRTRRPRVAEPVVEAV